MEWVRDRDLSVLSSKCFSAPMSGLSAACSGGVPVWPQPQCGPSYIQRGGTGASTQKGVASQHHPREVKKTKVLLGMLGRSDAVCCVWFCLESQFPYFIHLGDLTRGNHTVTIVTQCGEAGLCFCRHSWPRLIYDFGAKGGCREKGGLLILDFMGSIHPDPSV